MQAVAGSSNWGNRFQGIESNWRGATMRLVTTEGSFSLLRLLCITEAIAVISAQIALMQDRRYSQSTVGVRIPLSCLYLPEAEK